MTASVDTDLMAALPLAVEDVAAPRKRTRDLVAMCSAGWLVLIVLLAILAPVLPIANTSDSVGGLNAPPFHHWPEFLGTDQLGRSLLARVIAGARVSLVVGFVSSIMGVMIGGAIGIVAGVTRRRFDTVVGFGTETLLAFPGLVLLLLIVAVLGPGMRSVIIGLSIGAVPGLIRLTRANTIRFVDAEFVLAARALGASRSRVILREILPNVVPPMVAFVPIIMAGLLVAEAALSYLGIGLIPPTPSWGSQIAQGQLNFADAPFLVFVPAAPLFFTVFSITAIGEWLRTKLDRA